VYQKVAVFVNTDTTAEKLFHRLELLMEGQVALFDAGDGIDGFMKAPSQRILLIANESDEGYNFSVIPHFIQMELAPEKEQVLERAALSEETTDTPECVVFATDIELSLVIKIEQATGKKMQVLELPEDLIIETNSIVDHKAKKDQDEEPTGGGAFHTKKESNLKDYNYGYKDKRKMAGKLSKRRNS